MAQNHSNRFLCFLFASILILPGVRGHFAAWNKGMYCLNGTVPGVNNQNNNDPAIPLRMLARTDWWMHHMNKCDEFPPAEGDFLEIPSGGSFVVELAANRAFTTLSYDGQYTAQFGDGQDHPNLYLNDDERSDDSEGCITTFNIHTHNESTAAGTAFAISYTSDIQQVTAENLVVFTVLYHTPWKRIAEYRVPEEMPACPSGGCHCAWGWVPNGCGEPNMYMQPFKCKVVGNTGSRDVGLAVPPVWCEDDPNNCVSGPKQMVYWNQLEGNNVVVSGADRSGRPRIPAYNAKMGFPNGPQTDIFLDHGSATPTYIEPGPPSTLHVEPVIDASQSGSGAVEAPLFWAFVISCSLMRLLF